MRPGMVAVIADGPEFGDRGGEIARALGNFGLPSVRHVASATRTPGYVLQLVTQLDATFARALFVTVGSGDGALAAWSSTPSATPVVRAPATADVNLVALQCAKAFSLEDTVVFGRVLLVQANARSTVLQADACARTNRRPRRVSVCALARRTARDRRASRPRRRPRPSCSRSMRSGASIARTNRAATFCGACRPTGRP